MFSYLSTPFLVPKSVESNPCIYLASCFPKKIHNWVFGENSQPNFENVSKTNTKNNRKELAIYMLSENKGKNELMEQLFKSIQSKVHLMTRNSFFENQVDIKNVPVSSLAALKQVQCIPMDAPQ